MSRTCFVIMPFSTTASCTEEEWTRIFADVLKPAVEGAGLDYECRRSVATRGNIVGAILQDLRDAYVVLADLTDRNPNVFYELGVRHSLSDRSIILAQRRNDIPFDLQAYAFHVYEWKTEAGRAELSQKLHQLLAEVDTKPERPDNPVSDFLGRARPLVQIPEPVTVTPTEVATAQPLAGPGSEGLDAAGFARRLAVRGTLASVNAVSRLTRAQLLPLLKTTMESLNQRPHPDSVQEDQILTVASEYITAIDPHIQKAEEFVLASVEQDWILGTRMGLQLAGELISLSERLEGRRVRFAQGLPALFAWRLLILMGAKAIADDAFVSLELVVREPIEVESQGNRFSHLSLTRRRDLFWPETFLGHANLAMQYIAGLWGSHSHLRPFFGSEEDYHLAVGKFLMVVALADSLGKESYPLYPGYRLLPQSRRAMASLCGKLSNSDDYLTKIAQAMGESPADFRQAWSKRVARANSAELGSRYFTRAGAHFPDPLEAKVEEW